jgi:hypothetical protein
MKHAHTFDTWADRKRRLDAEWLAKRPARENFSDWRLWLLDWGAAQQRLERARQRELYA